MPRQGQALVRDRVDHVLARHQNQLIRLRAAHMHLCAQPARTGLEMRPQHRLDKNQRERQWRRFVRAGVQYLGKPLQRLHGRPIVRAKRIGGAFTAGQPLRRCRSRYRADDMQRVRIGPVQNPARDRDVAVIATGTTCRRRRQGEQRRPENEEVQEAGSFGRRFMACTRSATCRRAPGSTIGASGGMLRAEAFGVVGRSSAASGSRSRGRSRRRARRDRRAGPSTDVISSGAPIALV